MNRIRRFFSPVKPGLSRNTSGLAAIEFAIVAPVMLLAYLGGLELSEGISLKRMVALTAITVTNLVAQYTSISASKDMPDILKASTQVLAPHPANAATVVVTCISIDNTGKATIAWSQALNGSARTAGATIAVPAALDVKNTTLILGEVSYIYTPIIDFLKHGTFTLTSSIYMYPRASTNINLTS
jgi:Flp pilus assembly protein TadG